MLVALSLLYSLMSVNSSLRSREVQWSLSLHPAGNLELSLLVVNAEGLIRNEVTIILCLCSIVGLGFDGYSRT